MLFEPLLTFLEFLKTSRERALFRGLVIAEILLHHGFSCDLWQIFILLQTSGQVEAGNTHHAPGSRAARRLRPIITLHTM